MRPRKHEDYSQPPLSRMNIQKDLYSSRNIRVVESIKSPGADVHKLKYPKREMTERIYRSEHLACARLSNEKNVSVSPRLDRPPLHYVWIDRPLFLMF